uniref:Uncharacterized protein n=1 Tax=Ceratitis capitata TaxID=7213 RepID=W8B5S1_CERCA
MCTTLKWRMKNHKNITRDATPRDIAYIHKYYLLQPQQHNQQHHQHWCNPLAAGTSHTAHQLRSVLNSAELFVLNFSLQRLHYIPTLLSSLTAASLPSDTRYHISDTRFTSF